MRAACKSSSVVTGAAARAGSVALWAVLFGRTHVLTLQRLEQTLDLLQMARLATNTQLLIAVAVANERIIARPTGSPVLALTLLLFGGPLLVRLELTLYLWLLDHRVYWVHLVAGAYWPSLVC